MKPEEFQQIVAEAISREALLAANGSCVLVALSGGADSMALLEVLLALNYHVLAAHCNFHLRGDESNRDEAFVVEHCRRRGVELKVKHFDVAAYEREHAVSTEMACRELRYAWFHQLMAQHGCQAIAVAHHADDVAETFFLNALRGSGVAGLASIKPRNGCVVRPMLDVDRADVENYLQSLGVDYVVDSTNLGIDYKRNQIRNVVLPQIYELMPQSKAALRRTTATMRSEWMLYNTLIAQREQQIVKRIADGCFIIDGNLIQDMGPAGEPMLFHIVNRFGFNSTQAHEMFCAMSDSGKRFRSSQCELTVERHGFTVVELRVLPSDYEVTFPLDQGITQPVSVSAQRVNRPFSRADVDGRFRVAFSTHILNAKRAVLRRWRRGDRMRPFGMKGSKLLSDLFADAKLTELQKRQAWLLDVDGVIVWVLGLRSADAFRVSTSHDGYMLFTYLKQ